MARVVTALAVLLLSQGMAWAQSGKESPAATPPPVGETTTKPANATPTEHPKVGDVVNNPPFAHWAQFKPGASVSLKEVTTLPDGSVGVSTITSKLLSKSKKSVKVETVVSTSGNGPFAASSETTRTVTEFPAKVHYEDAQTLDPTYSVSEGKEVLAVKGKQFDTEWVESSAKNGEELTVEKLWTVQEVPGGIVKRTVTRKKRDETVTALTELLNYVAHRDSPHGK